MNKNRSNTSHKQYREKSRDGNSTTYKKQSSFADYKSANLSPRDSKANQIKPYEMWKQHIVTNPDTLKLDTNHEILFKFDQSNKNYLTTAKGVPNKNDYKSQNK
jgi:hypothetical protein